MIVGGVTILLLLGFLAWRRASVVPPFRIDRKVLWVIYQTLKENRPVTMSDVQGCFLTTPVPVFNQSMDRLMALGYIHATKEIRGGILYGTPYYTEIGLNEKGYRAVRFFWWIPW